MTANAVTDDQKQKPTPGQVDSYTRRENELRQRYLKGVLDFNAVLEGLQKLMEMTQGWINCNAQPEIPDWVDKQKPILQHLQGGTIEASQLSVASVFGEGEEVLDGEEYLARAQKLDSMNACAFDFYSKPENWKYLPKDVDVIVFPKTVFCSSNGDRCVRYLCRDGAEWLRRCLWVDRRFGRRCRVAVLASSTQSSESKTS